MTTSAMKKEQGAEQPKHTPGPWRIDPVCRTLVVGTVDPMPIIADTESASAFDVETDIANARLIAAAPEMLEALENALSQFNDRECNCDGEYENGRLVGHACYFHRIEQELKDAIAKASGGVSQRPVKTEYSTLTGLWFVYNASGVIIRKFPLQSQALEFIARGGA